ncbi:hypothetical protein I5E68_07100 [Novosphingobium sp. YJ-S2-02]|uniref:Uncharacterized protein n=1 Tax=Novosphingobium aureum TaxID=2792964 RepID=A0A931MKA9_9SPHN|nr:hypothetical protein [Novosphingobium aureum]MBH0112717.1 hypothetical protein [Novosphingobium aureum]
MKKYTNYALGARGIRTKGGVVFVDPGQTVEIDPKTIIGELPDLGKKADAESADTSEVDDLKEWVADLTKQVETLTAERDGLAKDKADLTKQVETLQKPAK